MPAAGGHASSDATVTWVRRHLDLLRIGGAVIAALALPIFSVSWATLLLLAVLLIIIIAVLLASMSCGKQSPPHSLPLLPAPGRNRDTDMPGKTPPSDPAARFQSPRSAPGHGT